MAPKKSLPSSRNTQMTYSNYQNMTHEDYENRASTSAAVFSNHHLPNSQQTFQDSRQINRHPTGFSPINQPAQHLNGQPPSQNESVVIATCDLKTLVNSYCIFFILALGFLGKRWNIIFANMSNSRGICSINWGFATFTI